MAKNQTYRVFVARPSYVLSLDGEPLDGASVLASLGSEVRDISVEASDDMMGEALRITEGARLIAAASGGLP